MAPSHRIPVLAERIAAHIRDNRLPPGTRLSERELAARFDMSRTPVRAALQMLADAQAVVAQAGGGYGVAPPEGQPGGPTGGSPCRSTIALIASPPPFADEAHYLRLANDHVDGHVPERVSENDLIRRYGLTRHQVASILHRAAREGWTERLPGHGWRFLPVLTSAHAYAEGYRFRILVEPAGILEPSFRLDRDALETCRARQVALLEGDTAALSPAALFDAANSFHATLIRCSRNTFFIDGLNRLTRLRRLIEYRKVDDRAAWLARCAEHVDLLDILLAGNRQRAAAELRAHLVRGARSKSLDIG